MSTQPTDFSAAPASPAAPEPSGCMLGGALAVAGLWIMAVVVFGQGGQWIAGQQAIADGAEPGRAGTLVALLVTVVLAALPAVILALMRGAGPRVNAVGRTWLAAVGCSAVFGLANLLPYTWAQSAAAWQIIAGVALLGGMLAYGRGHGVRLPWRVPGTAGALALALVIGAPMIAAGALGSPLDTLLNLLAGLVLGLVMAALAGVLLLPALHAHGGGNRTLAVWALAVTLLVVGGGFGFDGAKLLLMLVLPPLALSAGGRLARAGNDPARVWLPLGMLFGGVACAVLVFFDPDELTLLLGNYGAGDVLGYAFGAARWSFVLALVAGVAALLWRTNNGRATRWLAGGGLVAATVLAVAVYALLGRPGFYGERLFVVLRDQADTSSMRGIADRNERLSTTYRTLTAHANTSQADLRAALDRFGVGYQPFYLVNGLEVDGGPLVRAYLMTRADVAEVLDSPRLRPLPAAPPVSPGDAPAPAAPQWNITTIGADRVWSEFGVTGQGIVVGQSDSGVQADHPALAAGYRGRGGNNEYNWLDPWSGSSAPVDYGGHGTHTLGTAVGRGGIGVAPGAEWFACANLQRNLGDPALYLDCMQFMLAPFPQGGNPLADGNPALAAHVLNNSWGCPEIEGCDATVLQSATQALRDAGIFVVASAGNAGPACSTVADPIALYDNVFSVGAVNEAGNVASFSSRGPVTVDGSGRPKPDIAAPGEDVLSSLPNGTYGTESGTSMAGPHVVGVVALMWSANPRLVGDIDRTEQILVQTATPYNGAQNGCFSAENGISNAYGHGIVNAYRAVQAAIAAR